MRRLAVPNAAPPCGVEVRTQKTVDAAPAQPNVPREVMNDMSSGLESTLNPNPKPTPGPLASV